VYDPNGRKASITSSQFGTQQYGYDADGRLTSSIEPNGSGVSSPAQITYAYYANGQRSAVSVASSGLTQTNALSYSYRADGALRTQAVNAFATGTWSNQYTDAGRLSAVSGVDTQARSYDASGQLSSYTVSAGTATYTHDPEGSMLTEYLPNVLLPGAGSAVPQTITNTLNTRGELIDTTVSNTASAHRRTTTNSGCTATSTIPDDLSLYDPTADSTASPSTCDRVNGVSIAADSSIQAVLYNGQAYPSGTSNTEAFDATGRIVQTVHTAVGYAQLSGSHVHVPGYGTGDPGAADAGPGGGGSDADAVTSSKKTSVARAYDVENHLRTVQSTITSTSSTNPKFNYSVTGPATTIGWGPNGHPIFVTTTSGGTTTNETLHWDGDTILFVTNATGAVTDVKVGLDGDITPHDLSFTGLSVYDRDPAGVIVETSNATGSTGFNPLDPNTVSGAGAAGTTGYQAAVVPDQYVRGDGFMVAGVQINGVRAFDPNIGAWTTPDAYEGDVHDPASQQRYMFNRGNAADYSDPSGYESQRGWYDTPTGLPVLHNTAYDAEVIRQIKNLVFDMLTDMIAVADGVAEMRGGLPSMSASSMIRSAGRIPELAGGTVTEAGFLRTSQEYLGKGYTELSPGRYVSADGMRQVRFGPHETRAGKQLHAHYEAYDKPYQQGGHVIEKTVVQIVPDKK
jgi:YD repeat-containing protein